MIIGDVMFNKQITRQTAILVHINPIRPTNHGSVIFPRKISLYGTTKNRPICNLNISSFFIATKAFKESCEKLFCKKPYACAINPQANVQNSVKYTNLCF